MTQNAWTPGPWVVGTGHGEGWVEIGASGNALKTHGRTKRAQANRALIAAAPELAEALQKIADESTDGRSCAVARALLARINGMPGQ